MPFVSITRLRVRSWWFMPGFLLYAFRSARQASRAEGNLSVKLLNDRRRAFWTATLWTNEPAMKQFMLAGAHRVAMRKLLHWCDEAALAHWDQEGDVLPTWPEAHARLQTEGRRSRVNHPSPAHVVYQIPEPRMGPSEVKLK